ncbi:hypothetical protein ABK040_005428 [Willaertia magna]
MPQTVTIETIEQQTSTTTSERNDTSPTFIKLKLKPERKKKRVKFVRSAKDNEFKPMRTSKKCCVFKKKKNFGESDTESDSSGSDSECDCCNHDNNSDNNNNNNPTPNDNNNSIPSQ